MEFVKVFEDGRVEDGNMFSFNVYTKFDFSRYFDEILYMVMMMIACGAVVSVLPIIVFCITLYIMKCKS